MTLKLVNPWLNRALVSLVAAAIVAFPARVLAQSAPSGESSGKISGSATITGAVLDVSGAAVGGAEVKLVDANGQPKRTSKSGANGEFSFTGIAAGSYNVVVTAKGLDPFKSSDIVVTANQVYEMPRVLLSVAATRTEVNVRPTEVIAAEQVKIEESQRVLGILPNFYTSYLFDAAPLTKKQKYALAIRGVIDPVRFVASGVGAAIGQGTNLHAGYGQGAAGYGKRFAADYGDGLSADLLSHAVFPSILHQDPRYFYLGTGTRKARLLHAISFAVVARDDKGRMVPNYSYLLGDLGSGALSNLYYPHADRGAGLVFTNAAIGIGGRALGSVIREFALKKITTNAPGNKKP